MKMEHMRQESILSVGNSTVCLPEYETSVRIELTEGEGPLFVYDENLRSRR